MVWKYVFKIAKIILATPTDIVQKIDHSISNTVDILFRAITPS
jgi:hypothetical protein